VIRILEPGFETTVQDMGRSGNYHLGVSPSGAADKYSFWVGNLILGNPLEYAGLEMTFLGPKVEFRKKTVIAITGAPITPYINDQPIPMWENVKVQEGDVLSFTFSRSGVKTYLCVSGGIQVPDMLGSKSTYILSGIGGHHGRKLKEGDELQVGEPLPGVFKLTGKRIPEEFITEFTNDNVLRVVMGISSYRVNDEGVKSFLNTEWKVSLESDRVAYRYKGAPISLKEFDPPFGAGNRSFNVVDIAYPIGVIVVPNDEEIIVLMSDGTSGGGFVTIGTVISPDLDRIAQSRPLSATRFTAITVNQAIEVRMEMKKKHARLIQLIK
jgi:biotin-dependent carboxylase-like uncharacterized protein